MTKTKKSIHVNMLKVIWLAVFVSLPFCVFGIDLSRLYGHLGPPVQKRASGKHTLLFIPFVFQYYCKISDYHRIFCFTTPSVRIK